MFISEAPVGPFLELRADADGDGILESFPRRQGDLKDVQEHSIPTSITEGLQTIGCFFLGKSAC